MPDSPGGIGGRAFQSCTPHPLWPPLPLAPVDWAGAGARAGSAEWRCVDFELGAARRGDGVLEIKQLGSGGRGGSERAGRGQHASIATSQETSFR